MIPTILERIENLMGYKAIKRIKIKQGNIKFNVTREKETNIENNISNVDNKKLQSLINSITNNDIRKEVSKFAKSFFTNLK